MIIQITQKLTEIQNNIEQIQNITSKEYIEEKDLVFLLQLTTETETYLMDFNLLFKRIDKIQEIKEQLGKKYIEEALPKCNKLLKKERD